MPVQQILPQYLYQQYADDSDLQAFCDSYNLLAQQYLNTLNTLNLPIYPCLTGYLLDWVGQGIYGYSRPTVPLGVSTEIGPIATYAIGDAPPIADGATTGVSSFYTASDDIYIRCLNWHFYKGDGQQFSIEWLKRRIGRVLYGPGASVAPFGGWDFDVGMLQTISVTFATEPQVAVRLGNSGNLAQFLSAGIRSGVIAVPFQKSFDVSF